MNLEDRYKTSGKNTKATAYSGQSMQTKDHSVLNIDRIPSKYNTAGRLGSLKDPSDFNIDFVPTKYKG